MKKSKCGDSNKSENIHESVRDAYSKIATKGGGCGCGGGTCGTSDIKEIKKLSESFGYSEKELASLPDGANMGLSCGNPTALASLKRGEVVLDLGSGGGFDIFIAGQKVGAKGRAIGVDMTPDMLSKARRNIAAYKEHTGLNNVEFRLGEIEHLPVADASVDVVISNCVINLSPDKPQVWREIARVLKPGGRVSVSDIALLKPLPDGVRESVEALVGCVAGAALVKDTLKMVKAAGLENIKTEKKSDYIDSMADWSDPVYRELAGKFAKGSKAGDYVTSLNLTAEKNYDDIL